MKLIADTHTHSIASTHAYSTIEELVHAAAQKQLSALAITDHGILMPGAPGRWYFKNLVVLPRMWDGVLVLRGQECDVVDFEGHTDLLEEDLSSLDWIIASIHSNLLPAEEATPERVTNLWLKVAQNPFVHVIGHCGSPQYSFDYDTVIQAFGRNGKLVEFNESSFFCRKDSIPNCMQIMKRCKKYGVPIVVNTDSHVAARVGCFDASLRVLEELDFPEELVVNSSKERFYGYLRKHTAVFEESAETNEMIGRDYGAN